MSVLPKLDHYTSSVYTERIHVVHGDIKDV